MDTLTLEQVFAQIDKDGSGFLDESELKELMREADLEVSDEEIQEMMKMADVNGDGRIDLKEFKQLMTGL
ncbi:MAG: EF-hand domain-containing protein [Prochlorothrix sp.]|nr:EF-hand domain-containing protein [Prochlorothrix sp.]